MGRLDRNVLVAGFAAALVSSLAAEQARAQLVRLPPAGAAVAPPSIRTLPITPATFASKTTVRLRDAATGSAQAWLVLPDRDMSPIAAVVPATPRIALTADAVRRQIVAPLNRSLAFADRSMALDVPDSASKLRNATIAGKPQVSIAIRQAYAGVPVEHAGLVVAGIQGEGVRTIHGVTIRRWRITNRRPARDTADVPDAAYRALAAQTGVARDELAIRVPRPQLVLLPDGNADASTIALRYAWRLPLRGRIGDAQIPFVAWMDAESGRLLKLVPQYAAVAASARGWQRDPGTGALPAIPFSVDDASDGLFRLTLKDFALAPFVEHSDCEPSANGAGPCEVSIPANAPEADFDQPPINDATSALCRKWGNRTFQQASLFAQLHAYREAMKPYGVGVDVPIPTSGQGDGTDPGAWSPRLERPFCSADANMLFGACHGYYDDACPDYSDGDHPVDEQNRMNFAHDSTAIAHEFGHSATNNLWWACIKSSGQACPVGWSSLHDLADAWAADLENTNCIAGWVAKNVGGADASKNCMGSRGHAEGDDLPRLLEVSFPFDPNLPGHHFPEHRAAAGMAYRDMEIAATALWLLRDAVLGLGLGQARYRALLYGAMQDSGTLGADPPPTDAGIFLRLSDLQTQLLLQSALGAQGPSPANAIMASFAKVGIFPIDPDCLVPAASCGGAAVVEVDADDPGNSLDAATLLPSRRDHLRRDGPIPSFHVWTGPRFRLDSSGSARPLPAQAPCNAQFKLELSSRSDFGASGSLLDSGWVSVATDASTDPRAACYVAWTPSAAQWDALRAPVTANHPATIYYRVLTRDASNANMESSLQPTASIGMPAPFVVINLSGTP
jgi:hypothetical protein